MAFAIDRVEAARRLSISTRTVDRHIQAGRIRTKRIGKKMFLHEEDVELLRSSIPNNGEEYIMRESPELDHEIVTRGRPSTDITLPETMGLNYMDLYEKAEKVIIKKDELIQDLSYRLGKAETELKNSIPLGEYKKTTFLLESAKAKTDSDAIILAEKIGTLEKEIKVRNSTIIGLTMLFVLVLVFSAVFFLYTQFIR